MAGPNTLNTLSDEELDALSYETVARYKSDIWDDANQLEVSTAFRARGTTPIVGMGDSWFDYSILGFDILDFLQDMPAYDVIKHGVAGDTVENMAYGTEYRRDYRPLRPRIEDVLDDLRASGAKVLLLSGGGNDVAGPELAAMLNHAATGLPPIRQTHLDHLIEHSFRPAFEHIFARVWAIDPGIHIISHGYGYALPNGVGALRLFGYSFVGPWLRPAMTQKRLLDAEVRQAVVNTLIDRLNDLLADLARAHDNFHAVDARPVIRSEDWENELHLRNKGFRRVARLFDTQIKAVLAQPAEPLVG